MRKKRVLLTAFGPFGHWVDNASWQAIVEFTKEIPEDPVVVTRRYPVDFDHVKQSLAMDLAGGFDFAIHLGQAAGRSHIHLEAAALNVRQYDIAPGNISVPSHPFRAAKVLDASAPAATPSGEYLLNRSVETAHFEAGLPLLNSANASRSEELASGYAPLQPEGPAAYLTRLPLSQWARSLNAAGIPTRISHHAGTYVCNAAYYWSRHWVEEYGLATESLFIHLPLSELQVARITEREYPFMKSEDAARAIRWLLFAMNQLSAPWVG